MKKQLLLVMTAVMAMAFTACNDNDEPYVPSTPVTYTFGMSAADYNDEGVWNEVYNTGYSNIYWAPDLQTTHEASEAEYGGEVVKSWTGFCPSRSNDNADYTGGDWVEHQWCSITGGGANGSVDYMVACWPTTETSTLPSRPKVAVGSIAADTFYPQSVAITNTSWGYYAMLNGTDFNRAFTGDDWCKVTITGMYGLVPTGHVEVYLARNGNIVDTWQNVDLTSLGECNAIYFQMSSSDSGNWGMNNPAYFAMDDLLLIQ